MTAPSPRQRPRAPLLAALVLLLVAVAGGLGGIALDRRVLLPRMFHGPGGSPGHGTGPGPEHGPGRPPPRDREFRSRFAREVGLSPAQQQRIDSIMDREGRELRAVRGRVQPQIDSIIGRTRRQLDSVLTPEQRKKADEIRRRHPRPPRPPGGHPPGGPGEPPPGPPPQ